MAIANAVRTGDFQGIQITVGLRITHLLFVDDVLISYIGWVQDVEVLAKILSLFRLTTGMQINIQKSTLSFLDMEREEEDNYRRLFPFTI